MSLVKSEAVKEESEVGGLNTKWSIWQTTHCWMVLAQCFFTNRQRVVQQVGSLFVFILISVETGKVKQNVSVVFN